MLIFNGGQGTVTITTDSSNAINASSGTAGIIVPVGTTAQRPANAVAGTLRYNTTIADMEIYANGTWAAINNTPPPTNTVAPAISGSAQVNQTVSVSTGTWTNSPTSYSYQWLANSTAITNATANTFTITSSQLGANISCNVTATNISGTSSPTTSNSIGPVVATYTINFALVAGGGGAGGGYNAGGGGGAGGFLSNSTTVTIGNTYTITVGGGGVGRYYSQNPAQGGNSTAFGLTAIGGGYGESGSGGSGGGDAGSGGPGIYLPGGTGTAGPPRQGYDGGRGWHQDGNGGGGGGGGAGAAGTDATPPRAGGPGGVGVANPIVGSTAGQLSGGTYYLAGGGGGSTYGGSAASGGLGGGGNGNAGGGGYAGTANTGGGGGGGEGTQQNSGGGPGGSGVVILSMATSSFSNNYSSANATVTTSGSNTIVTFTSSGTYTA